MEDYLDIRPRESKDISRGILKGLEKRKYPSLEKDHFSQMKISKRESGEGSLSPSNYALCQRPSTLASDTVNLTLS